jgi:FkbM family methyltransferase
MDAGARDGANFVENALGNRIYFDPDDERGKRLAASSGDLNPHSLELWNRSLAFSEWELVVDVGSNYGEMIAGAVLAPTTAVVAFEPNVAVLPYLRETLAGLDIAVELIPAALGDAAGEAGFARDVTWSGKSSLIVESRQDTEGDEIVVDAVEVTTLDAILGVRHASSACIKIDVEGGEQAVLRGAVSSLHTLERWAIMLEILHMDRTALGELTSAHAVYLLAPEFDCLVLLDTSDPVILSEILASGWVYPQDAVLVSSRDLIDSESVPLSRIIYQLAAAEVQLSTIQQSRSWRLTRPVRWLTRRPFRGRH